MADSNDNNRAPLKGLIDKLMRAYNLDGRMDEMNIINNWEKIMGKAVANRTKKVSFRNRIMYLELDSSVMREELQNGKSIVILRVNEYAKKNLIEDVYFS